MAHKLRRGVKSKRIMRIREVGRASFSAPTTIRPCREAFKSLKFPSFIPEARRWLGLSLEQIARYQNKEKLPIDNREPHKNRKYVHPRILFLLSGGLYRIEATYR